MPHANQLNKKNFSIPLLRPFPEHMPHVLLAALSHGRTPAPRTRFVRGESDIKFIFIYSHASGDDDAAGDSLGVAAAKDLPEVPVRGEAPLEERLHPRV